MEHFDKGGEAQSLFAAILIGAVALMGMLLVSVTLLAVKTSNNATIAANAAHAAAISMEAKFVRSCVGLTSTDPDPLDLESCRKSWAVLQEQD